MPVARFQLPDGRVARFEVPDGTSPEQAQSMMESYDFGGQTAEAPKPQPAQSPIERDSNRVGAAIAGAADAASFGFGDELSAGLGAIAPALLTDKTLGQAYAENLTRNRTQNKAIEQRNPEAYLTGQIAGAIGTGVGGATTKGGAALANSLRSGKVLGANLGLAGRAGKAGLLGASTSGLAGFGAGEGVENRLESSGDSALAGGGISGLIPVGGAVAGKVAGGIRNEIRSLIPAEAESVKALRGKAAPLYDKFTNSGGVYSDKLTNEIADLADAAKSQGIAGSTKKADQALNEALDFYSGLRGKKLSPADLQKLDQSFADDIGRFNKAGEYNFGRILNNLKYEMRDRAFDPAKAAGYIESGSPGAVEALKEANRLYAQSYKAADVEKILAKAKGTENPQTSIRTNLKNLLANEKKMKNYSPQERAILEEAMKRGVTGGAVKLLGGRLIDSLVGGTVGFASGGPMGAIAGAVAGKAVGGVAADAAGSIQANRLRGALGQIQGGAASAKGGLPSVISNPRAGQLAAPAGAVIGGQSPVTVNQPAMETVVQPMSLNTEVPASSLMSRIKQAESSGNPNAQNPLSSASGLYQFTDATFRSAVDKFGRKQGIKYSDKNNPQAQEAMMAALTQDNARILQNKGIEPSDANLYFAHFMGAPAASKAISLLGKNAVAARSFPAAAKANPKIFFSEGKPRTVDEVYAIVTQKVQA